MLQTLSGAEASSIIGSPPKEGHGASGWTAKETSRETNVQTGRWGTRGKRGRSQKCLNLIIVKLNKFRFWQQANINILDVINDFNKRLKS